MRELLRDSNLHVKSSCLVVHTYDHIKLVSHAYSNGCGGYVSQRLREGLVGPVALVDAYS